VLLAEDEDEDRGVRARVGAVQSIVSELEATLYFLSFCTSSVTTIGRFFFCISLVGVEGTAVGGGTRSVSELVNASALCVRLTVAAAVAVMVSVAFVAFAVLAVVVASVLCARLRRNLDNRNAALRAISCDEIIEIIVVSCDGGIVMRMIAISCDEDIVFNGGIIISAIWMSDIL
jgi:hypothetical protein